MGDENQLDWLAYKHARPSNPKTSLAAAHSVKSRAGQLCEKIHAFLKANGSHTFEQAAKKLGLEPAQVWKRISDLKNASRVAPDGTAAGKSGRQQTRWRAI